MTPSASAAPVHAALALGGLIAAGAALAEATGTPLWLVIPLGLSLAAFVYRSMTLAPMILISAGLILLSPVPFNRPVREPLRANDIVLCAATLAFLTGLSGLARRDADPDARLPQSVLVIAIAVIVAQAAVHLASSFNFDWRTRGFLVPTRRSGIGDLTGRGIVSLGILALTTSIGGFIVWYARLASQTREQARATLLDVAWAESRRELSRQALFRARRRTPRTRASRRAVLTLGLLGLLLVLLAAIVVSRFVLA